MSARDHQTQVWREASQDLNFEFVAPFTLPDGDDTLTYIGLLPGFGCARGTLVIFDEPVDLTQQGRLWRAAQAHGYGFSCIELDDEYDRAAMIEVLNDWGWFGVSERTPSWYSGFQDDDDA